jgi:hypothetical protein
LLKNLGFSSQKARPLSPITSMKANGKRGAPRRGPSCCGTRKSGRPSCCVLRKRRSRSGAPSRIPGRGAASTPRSRLRANAKAIKSSG